MTRRLQNRTGQQATDMNRRIKKAVISIMALVCAGAIFFSLWLLWHKGFFLPRWIEWESGRFCDGSGKYEVILDRKEVTITYEESVIWTSPDGVKVQSVLSCDIDHDSQEELVLLCWKIGRYGSHRPFWVEKDEKKWSQHIFVYEYLNGEIRPKWMSSYLGLDVVNMAADGIKAPGEHLLLTGPDGIISSWRWDSWGFTKEPTEVSFLVFGDNLIHEPIYRYGLRQDESFGFLFENFRNLISESDIAVIHQETPLTDAPAMYGDYPRFGTPVQVGQAIADAGFDAAVCATNHALDRGAEGINFTKDFFDSQGVVCLGIQAEKETDYRPYAVLTKNGMCFALLNYTYGTNGIPIPKENPNMVHLLEDENKIREDLKKARAEADFVIVFVHWGTEYSLQTDEFQEKWAQIFLEEKVNAVVGTHPHVLQPFEVLRGEEGHEMLIYYSIGNFISAQTEESCIKGGMAEFKVSLADTGCKITEYSLQPLTITRQEGGKYTVRPSYGESGRRTNRTEKY